MGMRKLASGLEFFASWYPLMILLSVALIFTFLWLFFLRTRLKMKVWEITIASALFIVLGVLSVRFFALLEVGFDKSKAGTLSLWGGVYLLTLYYLVISLVKKIPLRVSFDVFVVPLAATLFLARINCLIAGCCLGKIIGEGPYRVPTRELELLFDAVFLVFVGPWVYKNKSNGKAYPVYMIAYGIFRFVTEFFRDSSSDSAFHIAHLWSGISVVIGAALLAYLFLKNRMCPTKEGGAR